jgi:threonine dehydratase
VALSESGVVAKAESLQPSGAFKLRGAFNALLCLDDEARARGVVAHSSGNHAVAVAYAGAALGVATTIVMPDDAPEVKLARTRALGARIVLVGPASSERAERAAELVAQEGLHPVEPYDSVEVVAATGTIGVEILEDLVAGPPPVLYVPVSGGGLIAGVATAAKLLDERVRVVGVEPALAADAQASLRAGERVTLPAEQMARTIADGLRVQRVGAIPWRHLRAHVDEVVTVTEDEIRSAMRRIASEARLVAEPSGAVPVAAALDGRGGGGRSASRRVAVLSGGNVDLGLLGGILSG